VGVGAGVMFEGQTELETSVRGKCWSRCGDVSWIW
jgi:hypothetical protein